MAAVTKEDFDKFMEDFRGLQVQVAAQHETIKKFTDGLTISEGAMKEQLEARLANAVQEMGNRMEETEGEAYHRDPQRDQEDGRED